MQIPILRFFLFQNLKCINHKRKCLNLKIIKLLTTDIVVKRCVTLVFIFSRSVIVVDHHENSTDCSSVDYNFCMIQGIR